MAIAKRRCRFFILTFFLLLCWTLVLQANPSYGQSQPKVYASDNGSMVTVRNQNLVLQIAKNRDAQKEGARIVSISYKGSANVVSTSSAYGCVSLYNRNGTMINLFPTSASLNSITGNNTDRIVLSFTSPKVVDGNGNSPIDVKSTITYTLYSDLDTVFVHVVLESSQQEWLFAGSSYEANVRFVGFETYVATGSMYHAFSSGVLKHDGSTPVYDTRNNILTLRNANSHIGVTLFPTSIFLTLGQIKDDASSTRLALFYPQPQTYDGKWYTYGCSFVGGITYSCGLAFSTDGNPFIVTPWVMPNSVPYGFYQTYDDLPNGAEDFMYYPPNSQAVQMNKWLTWLNGSSARRANLLLVLDNNVGTATSVPGGIDGSWLVHGNIRLSNMTAAHKDYLKSVEGKRIGFGIHGPYHHDYPWKWEFTGVTNVTWITATLNQARQDFQSLGLSGSSFDFLKCAGFRMRPEGLNAIANSGITNYDATFDPALTPIYGAFTGSGGEHVIVSVDVVDMTDDINSGVNVDSVYSNMATALANFNFVTVHGHFLDSDAHLQSFGQVCTRLESTFGDDMDYFLESEINSYWHNVLWMNSYTYNSKDIFSSSSDSRLTYQLLNAPSSFSVERYLSYSSTRSGGAFSLVSPNSATTGWRFMRLSGFASISNVRSTSDGGMSFGISQPSGTSAVVKIVLPSGRPENVSGVASWSFDNATRVITLKTSNSGTVLVDYTPVTPEFGPAPVVLMLVAATLLIAVGHRSKGNPDQKAPNSHAAVGKGYSFIAE